MNLTTNQNDQMMKQLKAKVVQQIVNSTENYGNEKTSKESTVWKIVSDKIESTMSN